MKQGRIRILEVAAKLFARKGYAGCSIREICSEAGVTKPVLYYHFRSKEHLYLELMQEIFRETSKNLMKLSEANGSIREGLIDYVSAEFRNCKSDPVGVMLLFRMMFSPEGEYPRLNFIEEYQRERKIIAGLIRDRDLERCCQDPEEASTALMGMMLIKLLEYLFTGRPTLTRRNAEKLVDLLLPFSLSGRSSVPAGIDRGGH